MYRDLDKEKILGDMRLEKLNDMFDLLKGFDDATDPQTLKKMFVYQDFVQREYDQEAREVTKEYQKGILDPLRDVAKIELQGNR